MAAATIALPIRTIRISTTDVRPSCVPPAAPKATPARTPPRITVATQSGRTRSSRARVATAPVSAPESGERNTRRGDLRQQRDARQRRDALAQGHDSTDQGHQGERDEGGEQWCGKVVAGACEI